jgi:hypothetical protein
VSTRNEFSATPKDSAIAAGEAAWLHRTPAETCSSRTVGQPPNLMKTSTALQASANTRVIVK